MIRHHPDDDLLLALAAGRLDRGATAVVATHLEACRHCRARLQPLEAVGGVLLTEIEPVPLNPDAFGRTLARLDRDRTPDRRGRPDPRARPRLGPDAGCVARRDDAVRRPDLPAGLRWPGALRGATISRWYWIGPGMRYSRVRLAEDPDANLFLLRIAAGRCLPAHTHDGRELTQVLHGAFDDGRAVWDAGDFDEADASIHHQPVVQPGGECICLATVSGRVRFDGRIARVAGALIGM